jgi:hypothetical protein
MGRLLRGMAVGVLLTVASVVFAQKTRNIVLITTDGLRWQEIFAGADRSLVDADNGSSGLSTRRGLRYLERIQGYIQRKRSRLVMQAGWDLPERGGLGPRQKELDELFRTTTRLDADDLYDPFCRFPYPSTCGLDIHRCFSWGTERRATGPIPAAMIWYCRVHSYLITFVEQLWNAMQSMPEYRDRTTLVITTDHGRGSGIASSKRKERRQLRGVRSRIPAPAANCREKSGVSRPLRQNPIPFHRCSTSPNSLRARSIA